MHQKETNENISITEYHICSECIHHISVPSNYDFTCWELACKEKRSEVNPSGGLTHCPIFKENTK